jgi:hypothetical protein
MKLEAPIDECSQARERSFDLPDRFCRLPGLQQPPVGCSRYLSLVAGFAN